MVASVNTNFIVQNGLTVGPTTIFAGNGDIILSGNITTTGTGSISSANGFGGLNPSQIYSGTSNVTVTSTNVFANISGAPVVTVASGLVTVAGNLSVGNLNVTGNTTTVNYETVIYTETANAVVLSYLLGNTGVNNGNVTMTGNLIPSANVTYNIGSPSVWYNSFYGTSTHAQYADLAENYQADKFYNPGTVLMFGGSAEVTIADADTTAVAGVVSTNPAHLMNGALTGQFVTPLALMGRVPCNVVGPVAKGDLLVSAGFGFAKTNNSAGVGQVIGKALADFPILAKGVIEVVVGRV